ncbi:uncharacterized protein PHACADRAFT_248968 [Phanerochaete carnosa HHB-10118-sp]|uniref:Anaphase-promoting complex subunit 4 WD40 domain-containing protein n=1 Tax=Phanerochaete carnosa (strain HHB-10118-sp) TaxID=650164 RepID=K5W4Q9_PHACS|nr:uncharacterized protein PHACADRAFT_248968 [Phanerochaete carnosa HHB-10118-sp]EKM58868.1 hypothetical protein PHACADRAFT_248968 [Phanerochaete carnosa HHB-10118-sp]
MFRADGTISISELLAREQFEKLEHRLITATDLRKWPNATLDDAGTSAMAPVQFTDDPDLSLVLPTKWRYLCFDSRLTADAAPSSVLASSPNGELLAATSSELEIIVWRLSDGLSVQRLGHEGHTETIASIAFSPDGGSLISGSADRTAIVWSLETGRALLRLVGHRETIEHVQYITHGLRIVTASTDSAVKFWDAKSGAPLCHFPHGDEIERLLISPDGSRFGVQMKHSVALYDTDSIVQLAVLEPSHGAKVATIAFSASGDRLFIGDHRGGGRVCNTDNCKEVMHLEDFPSKTQASAFAPDGGPLAAVWSQAVAIVTRDGTVDFMYHLESLGTAVAFSPNGEFIAAAGGLNEGEGEIRVWSTTSRQLIAGFTAPSSNIWDTKFLPDSRRLLTFAKEGPACLWNVGDALRVR